jgi:integrase
MTKEQMQSLNKLDIQSLMALREHYVAVAKANRSMDDISMMKSWEAQDWIVAIDARLSSPQQEISRVSVPVGGSADQVDRPSYTFEQFSKDYLEHVKTTFAPKTEDNAVRVFKSFKALVGSKELKEYTALDLENFKANRKEKNLADATINIDIRTLKSAFNVAVDWEKIGKNPFGKVKQIKIADKKKQHINAEEFVKIFAAIEKPWVKDVVGFTVVTGMRLGEVMNLKWDDYAEKKKLMTIQSSSKYRVKGGKSRTISLPKNAIDILKRRVKIVEWIFVTDHEKKVTNDYVSKMFKKAVKKVDVPQKIHFHSLRHTFGTRAGEALMAPHVIKQIMGHSSLRVTEGYIGDNQEFMAEEMKKMSIPKAKKNRKRGKNP